MKRVQKVGYIEENHFKNPNEELQFILWKAELNKELMSFWKSISK
jgi:hypothetical protein